MKFNCKTLLLAASLTLLGSGIQATTQAAGMNAEEAIMAAKEAQKHASSVGGEWRDTGKMIAKAEALLKEGKHEEAIMMAEDAEIEAMLGYMQATSQAAGKLHI